MGPQTSVELSHRSWYASFELNKNTCERTRDQLGFCRIFCLVPLAVTQGLLGQKQYELDSKARGNNWSGAHIFQVFCESFNLFPFVVTSRKLIAEDGWIDRTRASLGTVAMATRNEKEILRAKHREQTRFKSILFCCCLARC